MQFLNAILPGQVVCEFIEPPPYYRYELGFFHYNSIYVLIRFLLFNKLFDLSAGIELHNIGGIVWKNVNDPTLEHL